MNQRESNPYKNSDTNKRYYTYDYYTRHTFGGKCAKIPLDAGFSCPNKDGTRGHGGCIFCLSGSAAAKKSTIREQYEEAVAIATRKWRPVGYIPYLQANSNTYADGATLRRIYEEAAGLEGSVMLGVATRADCLSDEAIFELVRISEKLPVTVELGLQSSNEETCRRIGRGHSLEEFQRGFERLRGAGGNIGIGVHIINFLPGETYEDMMETARYVASLSPEQVKIHLLNVLRDTPLEALYRDGGYTPPCREDYVRVVCDQIEVMPTDTVIARVTGDSEADVLVAPDWSRRKTEITNMIDKELFARGSWQGKLYK